MLRGARQWPANGARRCVTLCERFVSERGAMRAHRALMGVKGHVDTQR